MSPRHRPDRRTVLRYLGLQLPGWGFLLIAGEAAHVFLDVPERWVWIGLGLWIVKDLLMFPFVWRAYTTGTGEENRPVVGREATTVERLDPDGYVRVGSELWRAHSVGEPVDVATRVRVLEKDGFTLRVEALPPGPTATDA